MATYYLHGQIIPLNENKEKSLFYSFVVKKCALISLFYIFDLEANPTNPWGNVRKRSQKMLSFKNLIDRLVKRTGKLLSLQWLFTSSLSSFGNKIFTIFANHLISFSRMLIQMVILQSLHIQVTCFIDSTFYIVSNIKFELILKPNISGCYWLDLFLIFRKIMVCFFIVILKILASP